MTMLKKIFMGVLALTALLVLIGFLLPRQFKVERSLVMSSSAVAIYPLVAAPTNWQKWSVWFQRDPNILTTFSGSGQGKGAKWSWQSKQEGNGQMEFVGEDSQRKLTYRLLLADKDMVSHGTLAFVRVDEATTNVIWTTEGDLGYNPVFRYFGLFMDRMIGKDFEQNLAQLKVLVEKNAAAEAVPALVEPAAELSATPDSVSSAAALVGKAGSPSPGAEPKMPDMTKMPIKK